MAVKTVNVSGFDVGIALGATAKTKAVTEGAQSFGDVLNKAGDKLSQGSQTTVKNADASKNAGQKKPETGTDSQKAEETKEPFEAADSAQETAKESECAKETPADKTNPLDEKCSTAEPNEEADEMATQQLADALAQIIEQLKQLLGISDEELLAGMESIGIRSTDLLNTDYMAQLLTAVAGEGEAISFVTNEDLYAALQEMTATVETVSAQLLEDMGLTQEELDALLEKLNRMQNTQMEGPMQSTLSEAETEMTNMVNEDAVMSQDDVLNVVVEENGKSLQTKTPENQSAQNQNDAMEQEQPENSAQDTTKLSGQKPEQDAHGQDKSNDFNGQQGAVQGFGENFNETAQVTADPAVSYTSGNADSILKQLADFVKIIKNENLTEMELQLHPASLGTVNVSLVTKGGAVTAEFTTQNEAVRAAIESQVSQLITNLEEQGVKVEAVEVSVASHQMERNLEENSQNDQSRQEQQEQQRVSGTRRNSINLNAFADGDELVQEMQEADDATRIAMELMAANGNSMDLMA